MKKKKRIHFSLKTSFENWLFLIEWCWWWWWIYAIEISQEMKFNREALTQKHIYTNTNTSAKYMLWKKRQSKHNAINTTQQRRIVQIIVLKSDACCFSLNKKNMSTDPLNFFSNFYCYFALILTLIWWITNYWNSLWHESQRHFIWRKLKKQNK